MRTITIRLPETLAADIEAESLERSVSKSDVVRERLETARKSKRSSAFEAIADLVGSVEIGPSDVSARADHYLRKKGYGRSRSR